MIRKLLVNDGRGERERMLVGRMTVGRDPSCDISDADPLLSGRHAEFAVADGVVTLRDLGSRNGILINGQKTGQATLRSGDIVQAGRLRLTYIEEVTEPAAPRAAPADADATSLVNPRDAARAKPEDPDATRLVNPRDAARAAAPDPDATSMVNPQDAARAAVPDADATRLVNPRDVRAAAAGHAPPPRAEPATAPIRTEPAPAARKESVAAPSRAEPVPVPRAEPAVAATPAPRAAEQAPRPPIGPVLVPVAALAAIVFFATALPFRWLGMSFAALAVSLAAATVATVFVSMRIHRWLCENYVPKAPRL